jgi:hypothetical protein
VKALLAAGSRVNAATRDRGSTPLLMASQNNHSAVVKLLLAAGANINQANAQGVSSLCIAAHNGHTDVVRELLWAGADASLAWKGTTPLAVARHRGHTAIAELLAHPERHTRAAAVAAQGDATGNRAAVGMALVLRRAGPIALPPAPPPLPPGAAPAVAASPPAAAAFTVSSRALAAAARTQSHPPHRRTAQPAPGDEEHDDGLPPPPASADAAWASVTAAIEHVGSVEVPRWACALAECVSALERVAYAAPALAGRGKPPRRASLPPGASAGQVERRWAGPLYGRDAVTVVGRGSVVGRELVGWVAANDGEGGAGGGGGGRRWLSGVFPASARDIAARFTERVLRPSGQGWLHACVGAVVPGHASLLMDEDEVGEWEPLPEVPAYPLVSARGGGLVAAAACTRAYVVVGVRVRGRRWRAAWMWCRCGACACGVTLWRRGASRRVRQWRGCVRWCVGLVWRRARR